MKCRFCNKEFEKFVELNKHELECWKAKCELERRQKEKEEIERRKAEEERKLREEINQRGKELLDLRNKFVVECNRFRNDFEHTKWFSTWEDMLIDDNTTIKFNNGSTIKTLDHNKENSRSKRGDEQLEKLLKTLFTECFLQ